MPCSEPAHIDVVVTRVLAGFEQGRGRSNGESDVIVGEYVSALTRLPLAAIHAAAERFRSGETILPWTRRYRPSPAEFAAEAREGLVPVRARLVHVRDVLLAEVYDPPTEAQRAKVADAVASYRRERGHDRPDAPGPAPEEIAVAREAVLREVGAQFRLAASGGHLGRLMGRLDAKRATLAWTSLTLTDPPTP